MVGLICELESVQVSYLQRMGSVQRAGAQLVFLIHFWEAGRKMKWEWGVAC